MYKNWLQRRALPAAFLALALACPAYAAEDDGAKTVAQQLNERTKAPEAKGSGAAAGGLSDSAVRVMSSYAWSILPDEMDTPNGKEKVDKSDPNKFLIGVVDARTIIRAAMRSAYAQICELPELQRQNYVTLMKQEENRGIWSKEQLHFINTLHMFAVSYFTGSLTITEKEEGAADTADGAAAKANEGGDDQAFNPTKPTCTPEKRESVTEAIGEYVKSAEAAEVQRRAAPPPTAPQAAVPQGDVKPAAPIATPVTPETAGAD